MLLAIRQYEHVDNSTEPNACNSIRMQQKRRGERDFSKDLTSDLPKLDTTLLKSHSPLERIDMQTNN